MGCPRLIKQKLRQKEAIARRKEVRKKFMTITTDAHFPIPEYDRLRCEADQEPSVFYWGNMTTIYLRKSR
jgi:hypothetical protein